MRRVGIIGWRGMVGSVLVQRMREEQDAMRTQAERDKQRKAVSGYNRRGSKDSQLR